MKRMRWKVQYQIEKTPMRKVTLLGKSAMHMEQIGHSKYLNKDVQFFLFLIMIFLKQF